MWVWNNLQEMLESKKIANDYIRYDPLINDDYLVNDAPEHIVKAFNRYREIRAENIAEEKKFEKMGVWI